MSWKHSWKTITFLQIVSLKRWKTTLLITSNISYKLITLFFQHEISDKLNISNMKLLPNSTLPTWRLQLESVPGLQYITKFYTSIITDSYPTYLATHQTVGIQFQAWTCFWTAYNRSVKAQPEQLIPVTFANQNELTNLVSLYSLWAQTKRILRLYIKLYLINLISG